jgi:hypothetical protein
MVGYFLLIVIGSLSLTGCAVVENVTPTPEAPGTEAPTIPAITPSETVPGNAPTIAPTVPPTPALPLKPTATPLATPTATATPPATIQPTQTPTPTLTPLPLTLEVLSPLDGAGVEAGAVRVMGITSGIAASINGIPLRVNNSGGFQHDLSLKQGVNLIEVIASDSLGRTTSQQLAVFFISSTAGLPLTLLYPSDGLQVSEPVVSIVGVTRPDAVVGVNEIPVAVDALGIFSTTMELEEGSNLIEVVAADLEGNVRFQTLVVFYAA